MNHTSTAVSGAIGQPEPMSLLNVIERASRDSSVEVSKLQALLDMQERVMTQQAKREYYAALAAVANELEPVRKNAKNPHIGNLYATLDAIDAALRPIYTAHGFCVGYGSEPAADGRERVTCTVAHTGGYLQTLALSAPLDATGTAGRQSKTGVQAVGSTVTYLRRYLLCMAFNVTFSDPAALAVDDDGEGTRKVTAVFKPRTNSAPDPKAVAWKDKVIALLGQAQSEKGVDALRKEIAAQYATARDLWPDMAAELDAAERDARERIRAITQGTDDWEQPGTNDPVAELVAEIEAMDPDALDTLANSAAWRAKTRDLFPPDEDLLRDAIAARKLALKAKAGEKP